MKNCIKNYGPTFGQFGKSVEKVQKTWNFHEMILKYEKVRSSFECLSQFVLKVTVESLLRITRLFVKSSQLLCLLMSGMKLYKIHQCAVASVKRSKSHIHPTQPNILILGGCLDRGQVLSFKVVQCLILGSTKKATDMATFLQSLKSFNYSHCYQNNTLVHRVILKILGMSILFSKWFYRDILVRKEFHRCNNETN